MKTKICSGKYGCNRELPVDQFKMIYYKNRGKFYPSTYCNDCMKVYRRNESIARRKKNASKINKYNKERYHSKPNEKTRMREWCKKYKQTESGKVSQERWRQKKLKDNPNYERDMDKHGRDTLSDNYIKSLLWQFDIHDPSPEIIQAKRLQLLLYRETKKLKDGKRSESIRN